MSPLNLIIHKYMKLFNSIRLVGFFAIIAMSLSIVSCEKVDSSQDDMPESILFTMADSKAAELVAQSNTKHGDTGKEPLASFKAEGLLEAYNGYDSEQEIPFVRITLKENTKEGFLKTAVFEVHLDDKIDFPELIKRGRVIYLRNQLIVTNLETNSTTSFYINDGMRANVTPSAPTIDGFSLILKRGIDALNTDLKQATCTCSCRRCFGGDCGSASASCGCQGETQSITCRDGYNAQCTKCDDGPQE